MVGILASGRRTRRLVLWGVLATAVAAIVFWQVYPRWVGRKVEVVHPTQGPLTRTIVTSGRVRPPARATLAPLVSGRVEKLGAVEGALVKAGDLLLSLDDAEAEAALSQAEGQLDDANAQGKQVRSFSAKDAKEAVDRARTRVTEARRTHGRIKKLFDSGVASLETLEDAGTALSLAESELRAAQLRQRDVRGTKVVRSDAALRQAEAARAAAEARLGYHKVTAPFDGVVTKRHVEEGDIAAAASPAFELIRTGATELTIEPDERNLSRLRLGQPARASAEAFPNERFDAQVSYIAPVVDARRGTIEIRLSVPNPPAYLRPDMTVSVEVIVAQTDDALSLETSTVRGLTTDDPWVLAVDNGVATRRSIVVGTAGDFVIEVLEGVSAEDSIIPTRSDAEVGDRIRAVDGTR